MSALAARLQPAARAAAIWLLSPLAVTAVVAGILAAALDVGRHLDQAGHQPLCTSSSDYRRGSTCNPYVLDATTGRIVLQPAAAGR